MVRTFLCQPLADPKVFSDNYEPTCGCCTKNGLILIASGSTNDIYVYSTTGRSNCRTLFAFQSIGAVKNLAHCSFGNYIISLERKWQDPRGTSNQRAATFQYARVYVNWMKEQEGRSYPLQHRNGYTKETSNLYSCAGEFSAIDILVKYSVNDISCCETNGNIAISTEAKVYLFAYKETRLDGPTEKSVIDFDCSLEIDSGFQINSIALFRYYVAFASSYEIRVIQVIFDEKESVMQAEEVSELVEDNGMQIAQGESSIHCSLCQSVTDQNFVSWNIEQGCSMGLDSLEHETITIQRKQTSSSLYGTPTYMVNNSCIKFDTIAQDATYENLDNSAKEVLGPKEFISGHPLIVINNFHDLGFVSLSHVTMLYRRYVNELIDSNGNGSSIHSIQWMPVFAGDYTKSAVQSTADVLFSGESKNKVLVSLGLFFSTGRKGYLYEILNTPRLLTEYDFTEACISACLTRSLLHVVTKNGLETYTTRLYSSASLGARAYQGESNIKPDIQTRRLQRTYSNASYSSGNEIDFRCHSYESPVSFSSDETHQMDLTPKEAHFAAAPREPKTASAKSTAKLSFKSKQNRMIDEADRENSTVDHNLIKRGGSISFLSFADKPNDDLYDFNDLIKPCPPSTIEVCLIGIYTLRGFVFIGSTDKHIVLLQKAFEFKGKRGSVPKERVMPWNVYVREIAPAFDVYRDIMKLIEGSEFANPSVFHQLLSEAHMILRADLTSSTPEDRRNIIRASIKRSAVKLGDFFARCSSGFDFLMAKEYYEVTGIKLEQVLLRHEKRDLDENLANRYGNGIIEFLNGKTLTNIDEPIQLSEDSVCHILKIYSVTAPHLLSTLILKSSLRNIPAEKAISIMEKFEQPDSSSSEYRLSTLDYIAMAGLHLQLCDPHNAEVILRRLSHEQLTGALVNNSGLILIEGNLTHFGQLLRKHFRTAFTSLLVALYDNGSINLEGAVRAYGYNSRESNGALSSPNYKMWDLLESLLDDEKRKEHYPDILSYLLEQYCASFDSKNPVDLLKIPHQHVPKGNGHFASRFDWLDKLPPFSGEPPAPQDCLLRKQMRSSASKSISSDSSTSPTTATNQQFDCSQTCSCCCCNAVLLKFQSLLCSQYCSGSTYQSVVDFFENRGCSYSDSIKLLCYPSIGKASDFNKTFSQKQFYEVLFEAQAVAFVVANHPSVMLLYAKSMFQNSKAKWQIFLDFLLKTLREELHERWNKDTYLDALKGALARLVRMCKPYEFVKLLPKDGTARFFLPFIQDCHQIHSAISTRVGILQSFESTTD